jgi:hypothetical protein
MERAYKNCRSCGMLMKRDQQGGGTNADGSRSPMFCSHCWQAGKFTLPDITAAGIWQLVKDKLKEFGLPRFIAWFFARGVPRLERWNN